ncbi:MAG: diacylglycerol kinase family lipid kinase, partial [Actinomycetota bacterium]|nr:diacylglycerol kinase family lipid kinase [Actinomycetota bacterium]
MDPVALLVNPSAGGGRAAGLRVRAEAVLRELRIPFHAHDTRDLDDARGLARRAARDGEVVATLGGDGLAACVADV